MTSIGFVLYPLMYCYHIVLSQLGHESERQPAHEWNKQCEDVYTLTYKYIYTETYTNMPIHTTWQILELNLFGMVTSISTRKPSSMRFEDSLTDHTMKPLHWSSQPPSVLGSQLQPWTWSLWGLFTIYNLLPLLKSLLAEGWEMMQRAMECLLYKVGQLNLSACCLCKSWVFSKASLLSPLAARGR